MILWIMKIPLAAQWRKVLEETKNENGLKGSLQDEFQTVAEELDWWEQIQKVER